MRPAARAPLGGVQLAGVDLVVVDELHLSVRGMGFAEDRQASDHRAREQNSGREQVVEQRQRIRRPGTHVVLDPAGEAVPGAGGPCGHRGDPAAVPSRPDGSRKPEDADQRIEPPGEARLLPEMAKKPMHPHERRYRQPQPLRRGEEGTPLAAVDIAWLRMDDATNLMHVHGVLPLAGEITWEQAAKPFAERLAKVRRFGQRVARDESNYGALVWTDDAHFDLHRHLVEERVPPPGDDAALAATIEKHLSQAFDRAHPLWQFHLLHGHRGGTVLFGRVHHAIGDGVALMLVILAMTDLTRHGAGVGHIEHPGHGGPHGHGGHRTEIVNPFLELLLRPADESFGAVKKALEKVMPETLRLMLAPVEAYERVNPVLRALGSASAFAALLASPSEPETPLRGELGVRKRVAWTACLDLEEVRDIGRRLGGTINDVLNTAMAGSLRRYLLKFGTPPESLGLRAAMPVNLRPLSEMAELGNRFGLMFLKMPVGIADPVKRLEEFRRRSAALKRSAEPLVVFTLLQAAGYLPEFVHGAMVAIFGTKATAVFTNVPGPKQTLYFAGQALTDFYFWVPQAGHLGLGVSILSYNGGVRMGVGTDAGLIPDPERIVDGFHAEFEALSKAASRS